VDHGSCGNACCIIALAGKRTPASSYAHLRSWLSTGGADGSYRYVNGSDTYGHRPSDQLGVHIPEADGHVRVSVLADQYILQGRHVTRGGYVDILNFHLRALPSGGTAIRAASISGIHGAFSDNGQNYKTLTFMMHFLQPSAVQHILFGCGHPDSMASSRVARAIIPISSIVPGELASAPSGARASGARASLAARGPLPPRDEDLEETSTSGVAVPPRGGCGVAESLTLNPVPEPHASLIGSSVGCTASSARHSAPHSSGDRPAPEQITLRSMAPFTRALMTAIISQPHKLRCPRSVYGATGRRP